MKIVQVCRKFYPSTGGMESVTYEVARRLAARGHRVTVLTSNAVDGRRVPPGHERLEGFDVFRHKVYLDLRGVHLVTTAIWGKLMGLEADVVHCQAFPSFQSDVAALACRLRKIPLVLTSHGFHPLSSETGLGGRILLKGYRALSSRMAVRASSACISLTEHEVGQFLRSGADRGM